MTIYEIEKILDIYETKLQPLWPVPDFAHLLTMIPKMREMNIDFDTMDLATFVVEADAIKRRDKLMRWLGFMQGVLWATGVYTIDQLKEHNRG